jgi:flagellin-like hook-associated protein FlgL
MGEVYLSSAVRANLAGLQSLASSIAQTQTRLATGKKVNSVADNPTNYFAAFNMHTRANSLSGLLDGIANAQQTLEAASKGIDALTSLLQSAQTLCNQALSSSNTTAQYDATVTGLTLASSFAVTNGNTITFSDGATTATITSTGTVTVQQIIDGINNTANLQMKAFLAADGHIEVQATGTNTIVRGGTASAPNKAQFGITNNTVPAGTLSTTRASLATQFDQIRAQLDQTVTDSSYNGKNLLKGGTTLNVSFNETGTSGSTITGVSFDSATLGVVAATNTFQTDKDVNDALAKVNAALATVQAQSVVFSTSADLLQVREEFNNSLIKTLNAGADQLTLADTNEEGAKLLALQTQQQLLTTALAMAASSDNVLRHM